MTDASKLDASDARREVPRERVLMGPISVHMCHFYSTTCSVLYTFVCLGALPFRLAVLHGGALSHSRRAGRKVLAWGHPVPDFPASDFMLPGEYRDAETLRVRAR